MFLSRSCLASFRCPAVSARVCVFRSFGALFVRVPPQYYSCYVVCYNGRFLPILCLGPLRTRYRVVFPSRSCDLTPKLLPCFMMGSVCPVHALYGPAPVESLIFVNPHQSVISFCGSSNDICQVCCRYPIELIFPRVRLVCWFR